MFQPFLASDSPATASRRRIGPLLAALGIAATLGVGCTQKAAPEPRVTEAGTSRIDHRHDGFPHYVGHFKAVEEQSFPHSVDSFTQGLEWSNGELVESTGIRGESTVQVYTPGDGDPPSTVDLDPAFFGEGATVYKNRIYQLTWQSNKVLVYDRESLDQVTSYSYDGEGWGLCNTEEAFVKSDGSSTLSIMSLDDFSFEGQLEVTFQGSPLENINELECIGDQVWANQYAREGSPSTTIYAINLDTGEVEATIDASGLVPDDLPDPKKSVLNGIAFNPDDASLWLTGKNWPTLYKVFLEPQPANEK